MIELRQIAVNIRHNEVDSWNFSQRHALLLQRRLPMTSVRICETDDAFVGALKECDACMVWRFRQEWFDGASGLKILSTPAAGRDYFNVTPPDGVRMLYGQFHGKIIGETVCGMLLGMCRGILPSVTTYAGEAWPRAELCKLMVPLAGSHAVILGLGHIGGEIGRMLKCFGVRISGMRRDLSRPAPSWFDGEDKIFGLDTLDDVLPTADHIILALPGTPETNKILNATRLNLVSRHATIINVGRGNAIEEMPLYAALSAGRISGAFLDVFTEEPLSTNSILRKCPNLWRMPHASAISDNYLDLYVEDFLRQLNEINGLHR